MKCALILLCAGTGARLHRTIDKAFVTFADLPLFVHSYRVFEDIRAFSQIIVVARQKHFRTVRAHIKDPRLILQRGGRLRQDSVYSGLQCVGRSIDHVLIHDSARPFITKTMVYSLLRTARHIDAVIPGVRVKEALKQIQRGYVRRTVDREGLYYIQTPQVFKKSLIMNAYKKYRSRPVCDDAQLVEMLGQKVKVIEGSPLNIKITYPEDLVIAEALINSRSGRTQI